MDSTHTKPKVIFFQYRYDSSLPEFLLIHKRDHVRCLAEFFDVTVIHEDCDYQQICDKYEQDLTIFEAGLNHLTCQKLKVTNINTHPEIPKIGFHNADGWCDARAGFLSDMEHWGIETFFSISLTAAEHTPEIADRLFIWPNFVDPQIYRDYGESKIIPVLLIGANTSLYPWRLKISRLVSEHFPTLICPFRGYSGRSNAGQVIWGEQYARTINASWFVPACGSIAKEAVRKHFEVPACRACLVTEESPALLAAGFVDMKNCVFADEYNILDRLEYLLKNPEKLEQIITAGHELVNSRHTIKQRDQILQWLNLHRFLKPGQKIVQANPFDRLSIVEESSGTKNAHITCNGLHLRLLQEGDEKLWAGKYDEAHTCFLTCANHMRWMPEPKLRLTLSSLYKGDAKMAMHWILPPIQYTLSEYKADDPDPVEWAYFIICLLCQGKLSAAVRRAKQFPQLRHPELDRVRRVVDALQTRQQIAPPEPDDEPRKRRYSIHQLPERSFAEWLEQIQVVLVACGQHELAAALPRSSDSGSDQVGLVRRPEKSGGIGCKEVHLASGKRKDLRFFNSRAASRRLWLKFRGRVSDNLNRLESRYGLNVRRRIRNVLRRLESRYGYFLPYHLSQKRNDEFFRAIQALTAQEEIRTALIVGAADAEESTRAFLAGIAANQNKPSVFCIKGSKSRRLGVPRRSATNAGARCYQIAAPSAHVSEELEKTVQTIKQENHIGRFDIVMIDGSELGWRLRLSAKIGKELAGRRFVLLDDINSSCSHDVYQRLLENADYALIAQNPGLRDGYAIFRKASDRREARGSPANFESSPERRCSQGNHSTLRSHWPAARPR